jgi:type V secretory pathway adhesin AidA
LDRTAIILNRHHSLQEGVAIVAGTGVNIRTNTAGKTAYVTAIRLYSSAGGGGIFLKDSTVVGGANVFYTAEPIGVAAGRVGNYTIPSGKKFSTGIFADVGVNSTWVVECDGWEE